MDAVDASAALRRARAPDGNALISAAAPAVLALSYPAFVDIFHWSVGDPGALQTGPGIVTASVMLMLMLAVPAYAFLKVLSVPACPDVLGAFAIRARRLAYATIAAPTLYCFVGVTQILLSSPLPDEVTWAVIWTLAIASFALFPLAQNEPSARPKPAPGLRVAHGISALVLLAFVAFHLTNHLFAWLGQEAHAAVMEIGRTVYRSRLGEPILIVAALFQIVSGLILAWRWSAFRVDFHRAFQIATGVYLSVYILGHMNSVFVFARTYLGIPTGWDFATGAPNGLIHDAWSARLIPHYGLAVFAVVAHLFSGLRGVMLAHQARISLANCVWAVGTGLGALLSLTIMLAMCGLRLP